MQVDGGLVVFCYNLRIEKLESLRSKNMNSFRCCHFGSLAARGRAAQPVAALCEHKWQSELLHERSLLSLAYWYSIVNYHIIYVHVPFNRGLEI